MFPEWKIRRTTPCNMHCSDHFERVFDLLLTNHRKLIRVLIKLHIGSTSFIAIAASTFRNQVHSKRGKPMIYSNEVTEQTQIISDRYRLPGFLCEQIF